MTSPRQSDALLRKRDRKGKQRTEQRMKIKIEQIEMHSDNRGFVFEPVAINSLQTQENCHVVISGPGVIRGNHYHLKGTETIALTGPALLRFKEGNDTHEIEVPAEAKEQISLLHSTPMSMILKIRMLLANC